MSEFYLKTKVGLDTSTVQSQLNKLKPTLEVTTKLKGGGTKQLTTFTDGLKGTVKVAKEFDSSGKLVSSTLQSVKVDTTKASTAIGQLGKDFISTTGKVLKFAASTAVIGMFINTIRDAIQVVKDFDSALTEFKKVSSLRGKDLDDYTQKLGELGSEVARTGTQMLEASTEFKKSGYSDEQSAQLAKVASLYQNIADSELTAGQSASFIISQMKAFNVDASNAISIIDQVNEVSNNFAVSSTDVSTALTKTSSAMGALGNTSQETIGLVTAGTEIMTHQASKVSRGLNCS